MTANENLSAPVGYLELLRRNANFRYLWSGQVVSLLGDWFNLIASAALVANLTRSGLAVGGLFVIRMLAPFLVSPLAGVAADRYDRRRLLILTDLTRALTVLGFLLVRDPGDVWLLYALTAVQLGISGFFFPARNAILPDITRREELGAANAILSATWSTMLAVGAALGGLASGFWGIYPAFVIDAATFLVSAVLIARIAYARPPALAEAGASVAAAFAQYVEGLRYLRQHLDILAISLHKAANGLFIAGAFQVIQVAIAERVFVIGEGGGVSLGILFALTGVGTGLGPILARVFTGDRERALRWALLLSYVVTAAGVAMVAPLWSFNWVMAGNLLRGLGAGTTWVFSTQLLLMLVPDQVRGRVFGTEFALFTLATAASSAAGGWLIDATPLGLSGTMWLLAGLTLLPALLWGLWMHFGRLERVLEPVPAAPVEVEETLAFGPGPEAGD